MPRHLVHLADLLRILVRKEIKLRYRGTTMGILWSLANPIAFALVLHVAFQRIIRLPVEDYAVFVLAGLFPWQWLVNSLTNGTTTYVQNRGIVRKLAFPRVTLSLAVVLSDMLHFLVTIPVLLVLVWVTRGQPDLAVWVVGVPALIAIQTTLIAAVVTLLACLNAFLRDLEHAVRVGMLLGFYVTPIIYPVRLVPAELSWILYANPVAPLIISWRELVLEGTLSPFLPVAALHAVLLVLVVAPLYRMMAWRIAEVV